MASLAASATANPTPLPVARIYDQSKMHIKHVRFDLIGFRVLGTRSQPLESKRPMKHVTREKSASVICASAMSVTCAAEQTQTIARQSSTITVAPIQGKEKTPELDDGDSGLPPGDDDDGGGGGGGGGWGGGFFFFGFLALLGLFRDSEDEGGSSSKRQRRR